MIKPRTRSETIYLDLVVKANLEKLGLTVICATDRARCRLFLGRSTRSVGAWEEGDEEEDSVG